MKEITIEKTLEAMKMIKNGKAAGHDGIKGEMLKYMGIDGALLLLDILNEAWKTGKIPNDWKVAVIMPIFKKGDPKDCNNYRGISLLSTALKVYMKEY